MKKPFASVSIFGSSLVTLLIALLFSFDVSAQSIRGFIRMNTDGEAFLEVAPTATTYRLLTTSSLVANDLRNLKQGDFLVARGSLDEAQNIAFVDTIETVGLANLIGAWQSGTTRVYDFEDFSRLNLYKATQDPKGVILSKLREMNYLIAPESGGRYSIFMSDNRSVQIGFLDFTASGVELSVIDPKTGRVSEHISLSPIPVVQ
ncbi:MAG: hypothetical protein AAB250_13260 [Bdellovibrionota bacterium]